jgi:tripartite-type tricarboxylate transporter receptor subunit TctC
MTTLRWIMNLQRRELLCLAVSCALVPAASRIACAQAYPARPVRIIVGFPAGGPADTAARLLGQRLSERLGQPFIIENRPGAGTNIGTEFVVRAPADGHTLLLAVPANTINATLYEKLGFNFLRDMVPVAGILREPMVMEVNPSVPVRTVPEFIAYAKANPHKLSMASGGIGAASHVSGELFKMMAGIDMVHVPYRGSVPALTDMVSGQVQVMFDPLSSSIQHIKAGKLRPLAVTTAMRSEALPDVPTVSEFVQGYETSNWFGICAPKNTPASVVEQLNRLINTALAEAETKARLAGHGAILLSGSPKDFGNLLASDTEKWAKVIKFAGIKPE